MPNVPSLIISTCHFYLLASAFVSVSPSLRELPPEGTSNHLEPAGQANLCWRFSHHHVLSIWKDSPLNLIKFHLQIPLCPSVMKCRTLAIPTKVLPGRPSPWNMTWPSPSNLKFSYTTSKCGGVPIFQLNQRLTATL